jgi:hypothetical protein
MRSLKTLTLSLLALLTAANAASAGCYDVFGCSNRDRFQLRDLMSGPNCEFLYGMRNGIYAEHHFCFRSPRAIAIFGNQGCVSDNPNALGMNAIELANAMTILKAERAMGCPE